MADEEVVERDADQDDGKDERVARRDAKRREALSRRAQDAETKLSELEGELDSYRSKAGELDKIVERKDSTIEKLRARLAELEGTLESERAGVRTGRLLDRLSESTGVTNRAMLRGLLREARDADPDLDISPEQVNDRTVKDVTRAIQSLAPELFKPKEGGERRKPPAAPGSNASMLPDGERPSVVDQLTEAVRKTPRDGGFRPDW